MKVPAFLQLSLLLTSFSVVVSSTDEQPPEAESILRNVGKYSKLYVSHHNCAWSPYEYDDQNDNGDNDGNGNNACGVEADDDELWYTDLTECYRANTAYSLYGVLKGDEDNGCRKANFINSFYTKHGIEQFVESLAQAGAQFDQYNYGDGDGEDEDEQEDEITSDCTRSDENDGGENNNQADYSSNNVKVYQGASSYGVGCKAGMYVIQTYNSAYCDARTVSMVTDELSTFNTQMDNVQCVAIYDADASNKNNNNGDDGDDNDNDQDPLDLLRYSEACDIRLYPNQCPDPYGKLKNANLQRSYAVERAEHPRRTLIRTIFSWLFLGLGITFLVASIWAYYKKVTRKQRKAQRQQEQEDKGNGFFGRNRSKVSSNSNTSSAKPSSSNNRGSSTSTKKKWWQWRRNRS